MSLWRASEPQRWLGRVGTRLARLALVATLLSGTLLPTAVAHADPEPILWGAYINGVPWDASKLDAFESRAGKRVSIIQFGNPWVHNGAFQKFPAKDFDTIR